MKLSIYLKPLHDIIIEKRWECMAKYLDGLQQIEDTIQDFTLVASGSLSVGTNQSPTTGDVNRPPKINRNYILVFSNKSGQVINSIQVFGANAVANTPLPNTPITGALVYLKSPTSPSTGSSGGKGVIDLTSEEPNPFILGKCQFQFNLAAAPTSGSIDWALIGY
jgi:hypothetical protein